MKTDSFKDRDFLTTGDFGREEIETIIDMESDIHHPCQGMADILTMEELKRT